MKKRAISLLLGSAMVIGSLAACGKSADDTSTTPDTSTGNETVTEATAQPAAPDTALEAIPDPVYYYSFDEADASSENATIQPTGQDKTTSPILSAIDKDIVRIPGVKGEAVYLDGTYGLRLTDVNGVGETYTISYWMYSSRNANYMPTIQWGNPVLDEASGNQHYNNITWAAWGQDGAETFPCVWSYDSTNDTLVNNWPNWAPDTADTMLKQWVNITLVVDDNVRAVSDENALVATVYVNGEPLTKIDSDGNVVETVIVPGVMAASDNYDFLLGVNYWDAIYKGAFDEVYVFDQALTAGQAKTLYEMGDPTVALEEPERIVEVVENPNAIDTVGTTDLSMGFWSDWSSTIEIPDGATKEIVLKNYSDGAANWDNYVLAFTNTAHEDGVDPNTVEGNREWVVVRADAYGWEGEMNPDTNPERFEFSWDWGNWGTWLQQVMVDADVTLTINRDGEILNITAVNTDYNGTPNTVTAKITTDMTDVDDCFLTVLGEKCYIEILSVDDAIVVTEDANAIDTLGSTGLVAPFWSDTTDGFALADGDSRTVKLNNYSDGVNNWDNFVVAFANTEVKTDALASGDNYDGYAEYGVLRADAFGWGDEAFAFEASTSWGDDWAGWLAMMKDADVTLNISRDGGEVTVDFTFVGRDGSEWTETIKFTSTMDASSDVYFFFTNEASYVELLSVE